MMDNWAKKDQGPANYGSRGVWGQRSSTNRRPPFAGQRSIPLWEKKFCESVGLIPWHKLLEAKKFMYLYEDVVRWNDTAAEEAFKNAKSRFWAEMNGLPCNVKLPDPDIYIDKVDWNTSIDPELLLDLERGPDIQSKSGGAEGDIVMQGKPFMLDTEPFLCNNGWDDDDEVPVPVPPTGSAESHGWVNWNETTNAFSCNNEANQCGAWDVREDLNGSKGWNNWDDDDDANNYASKCNWQESGRSDPWQGRSDRHSNECAGNIYGWEQERVTHLDNWGHGHYSPGIDGTGRNPAPQNSHWRRKDEGGGVRAPEPGADRKMPMVTLDDYRPYRGYKNNRGRKRQERPRWADRKPSYGRW